MNWADIAILVIIFLSALISVLRGFVKEALSLAGLVIAFWVAFTFKEPVAALFENHISVPSLQLAAGFAILFIGALIIAGIINYFAGKLVEQSGLTGTDRMLGVIFGIVRGAAIVAVLVWLAGLTPLPQDPWWKESMFVKHFKITALWINKQLPPDIAKNFIYDDPIQQEQK
jgi:membrane protein required for colicin V production